MPPLVVNGCPVWVTKFVLFFENRLLSSQFLGDIHHFLPKTIKNNMANHSTNKLNT